MLRTLYVETVVFKYIALIFLDRPDWLNFGSGLNWHRDALSTQEVRNAGIRVVTETTVVVTVGAFLQM